MGVSSTQEEICPIEAIGGFVRAVTFSEVPAQSAGWRCFLWKIADPFRKGFLTHFDEDVRKFEKSSSNKSAFIFVMVTATRLGHLYNGATVFNYWVHRQKVFVRSHRGLRARYCMNNVFRWFYSHRAGLPRLWISGPGNGVCRLKSNENGHKSECIFWRFPSTEASHGWTVLFLGQVTVPDTRRVWTCPTHHHRF